MVKLVCDRCDAEYTDETSITMAKQYEESWVKACDREGDEPRGIIPCPNICCSGELILKEA